MIDEMRFVSEIGRVDDIFGVPVANSEPISIGQQLSLSEQRNAHLQPIRASLSKLILLSLFLWHTSSILRCDSFNLAKNWRRRLLDDSSSLVLLSVDKANTDKTS
uniref:Uncharacterized protein n=1 Tax=Romanomermis culicivorax TaxID=13658 RepID=A0A915J663_ROMCU